jgi:hypothetical protein
LTSVYNVPAILAFADIRAAKGHPCLLLAQLLDHAYHIYASHFLLAWSFLLVLIVICGLRLSGYGDSSTRGSSQEAQTGQAAIHSRRFRLADGVSLVLLVTFLASYIFLIFYKENFVYYDDDMLTDFTLQGKTFPTPIWPDTGRFYPLADQEFNLLKSVTRSPVGYHSLIVAQLVLFVLILYFVLREFRVRDRALIVIFTLVTPSFLIPFSGFVYPERNVIFWFAVLVLCLLGYDRTKAPIYFVGCLAATHFALYYKEIVVLFVVAFALTRVALDLRDKGFVGRRSWQAIAKENVLSLAMLAVSAIYVVLFVVAMIPHHKFSYIAEHRETLGSVLVTSLELDWLPLILLVVLVTRLWRFGFGSGRLDPVCDPLAVGALAYCVGVVALKLSSGYYLAPADFIAILYLAMMSLAWLSNPTKTRISLVSAICVLVLLHSVAYSAFRMVERKDTIILKSQLAEFLRGYKANGAGDSVALFFPFTRGYDLMGFSSYLKYRGFQLAGESDDQSAGPRFVIESRERFANDRCVDYRDYTCLHADTAPANALIVVLPDDNVSMSEVEEISKGSTLLFSKSAGALCTRTDSWFRRLHAISPEFSNHELPEHWLQLQVFKKSA